VEAFVGMGSKSWTSWAWDPGDGNLLGMLGVVDFGSLWTLQR